MEEAEKTSWLVDEFACSVERVGYLLGDLRLQLERLGKQSKGYKVKKLQDIANEIIWVEDITESNDGADNSIYVPHRGYSSPVLNSPSDWHTGSFDPPTGGKNIFILRDRSYFRVDLKRKYDAVYVAAFLRSDLGTIIRRCLVDGSRFSTLNKERVGLALIALPSVEEQRGISSAVKKLADLKKRIEAYGSELALNPTSAINIHGQLELMLGSIEKISEVEKIRELVRHGESIKVEFKETFGLDVKSKKAEKYIEESALKTIVAFMNSDGGELLIGVTDDGRIEGVNAEVDKLHKKKPDNFQLHFKNRFKVRIGPEFNTYVKFNLVEIGEAHVFRVKVNSLAKNQECYLDNDKFFVRTGPATDQLEGKKLGDYLKNRSLG